MTGVSSAGCSSGCCGPAAGCGEGPGRGCSFCHLTWTTRRKRAKQLELSELQLEGLGISGLLVYKCWAHLNSCPFTALNLFEQCFFQSGVLAVPIMTGQDPKGRGSCEGSAVTFRWLPWATNLLDRAAAASSSGQCACRSNTQIHKAACAGCETRILCPHWLRETCGQEKLHSHSQHQGQARMQSG